MLTVSSLVYCLLFMYVLPRNAYVYHAINERQLTYLLLIYLNHPLCKFGSCSLVSDIAVFVLKRDVKLQPTNHRLFGIGDALQNRQRGHTNPHPFQRGKCRRREGRRGEERQVVMPDFVSNRLRDLVIFRLKR